MTMRPYAVFFLVIVALVLFGLGMVYDASVAEAFAQFGDKFYFVRQQALWAGLGFIALGATALLPPGIWRKAGIPVFFLALILLAAVLIPGVGTAVQGARRWLVLGPVHIQPSELAKLGVILFFSSWLVKHQRVLPFLFFTGLVFGLVALQPDLGTGLILLSIAFALFIAAGGSIKHVLTLIVLGLVAVGVIILLSPYKMRRVTSFINPDADPLGASYHIRQITIALGSGGWTGQGIGKSRQKYRYIPEASTDSIFAIAAEEMGLFGASVILALYLLLITQGFRIVQKTENKHDQLLATGIVVWIAAQTALNLASVVALVPLTGVPLPFFSYGGSSLLSILAGSGILISIGRRSA